jgi:hypothetical protein
MDDRLWVHPTHKTVVRTGAGGAWSEMRVGDGFWRDLEWWSDHLERRNCVSLEPRVRRL